jgi:hypothetical protein
MSAGNIGKMKTEGLFVSLRHGDPVVCVKAPSDLSSSVYFFARSSFLTNSADFRITQSSQVDNGLARGGSTSSTLHRNDSDIVVIALTRVLFVIRMLPLDNPRALLFQFTLGFLAFLKRINDFECVSSGLTYALKLDELPHLLWREAVDVSVF